MTDPDGRCWSDQPQRSPGSQSPCTALDVRGRRVWATEGGDGLGVAFVCAAAARPRGASENTAGQDRGSQALTNGFTGKWGGVGYASWSGREAVEGVAVVGSSEG